MSSFKFVTGGHVSFVGSQGGCIGSVTAGCWSLVAEVNVVGIVELLGSVVDLEELCESDTDGVIEVFDVDDVEGLSIYVDVASYPLASSFSLDVLCSFDLSLSSFDLIVLWLYHRLWTLNHPWGYLQLLAMNQIWFFLGFNSFVCFAKDGSNCSVVDNATDITEDKSDKIINKVIVCFVTMKTNFVPTNAMINFVLSNWKHRRVDSWYLSNYGAR